MLQKVLQSILKRYFGEFITGLDKVELTFWSGKINIHQASLKHAPINQLLTTNNIPLSLKFSHLGALQIDIPWNKLASAPVQIKIKDLYLVLKLQKFTPQAFNSSQRVNAKVQLIKNYVQHLLKKSQELKSNQQGYMKKMLMKILHNVNIQIEGIHVRIQSQMEELQSQIQIQQEQQFVDCEQTRKQSGFALGFCLRGVQGHTVNQRNQKQFLQVQNPTSLVRKNIQLREISCYWQQQSSFHLYQYPQQTKLQLLRQVIGRKAHRLLTVDGQVLMQKNKQGFGYYLSTRLNQLQVQTHYNTVKQMIAVYNQFVSAQTAATIFKMKQLQPEQQLLLEQNFKVALGRMQATNFKDVSGQDVQLVQSISKKLLMQWTRAEVVQLIRLDKIQQAYQLKNKGSWMSFITKSSPIDLTPQETAIAEQQVQQLLKMIQPSALQSSFGVYLHVEQLRVIMHHPKMQQQLVFSCQDIQSLVEKKRDSLLVNLSILSTCLTYHNFKDKQSTQIFRKTCSQHIKLLQLQVQDSSLKQIVNLATQTVRIKHQIQFLGFISEVMQLNAQQKSKRGMVFVRAGAFTKPIQQPKNSAEQPKDLSPQRSVNSKKYEYGCALGKIELVVQVDQFSHLQAICEGVSISSLPSGLTDHKLQVNDMQLLYRKQGIQQSEKVILQRVSVWAKVSENWREVQGRVERLKMVINQQMLFAISRCFINQYRSLKLRQMTLMQSQVQTDMLMQGQTQIIDVLKNLHKYHTVLTPQQLVFYLKDDQTGKTDYRQPNKQITLLNQAVAQVDAHSFRLNSMLAQQIITCSSPQQTSRWVYLIQQSIFQMSSPKQKYEIVDKQYQNTLMADYRSHIDVRLGELEVVYQLNQEEKVMELYVGGVKVVLEENSLQFTRRATVAQLSIINQTIPVEQPAQMRLLLSNTYNYFEDINTQQQKGDGEWPQRIQVLIEGKKKNHPEYTGQLTLKANINKLFINYCPEFIYKIIYRLNYPSPATSLTPQAQIQKILQILRQVLGENQGIQQRFQKAGQFEYNPAYVDLHHYSKIYNATVLFHVQLSFGQLELYLFNGGTNMWLDRAEIANGRLSIDKGVDFMFVQGAFEDVSIRDVTGYPQTAATPFTVHQGFNIAQPQANRKSKHCATLKVGVFKNLALVNRQRFKNVLQITLYQMQLFYQQQPFLRFIDYLINQIVLFIMQPFQLHKFQTPFRGQFSFPPFSFTQKQIHKVFKDSGFPFFTHLNITAVDLLGHFNSHPFQPDIPIRIANAAFRSAPFRNPQRIHTRLDQLKKWRNNYPALRQIEQDFVNFERCVTKSQWMTRYLITAQGCKCSVIENQFNLQMCFEKCNHLEKPMLLPFLRVGKQLVIDGKIKHLNVIGTKPNYDLINRCFMHNLSFDDKSDSLFNVHHPHQSNRPPAKLIFRLTLGELTIQVPQHHQTALIIQGCQYKMVRYDNWIKEMEVNGISLHILSAKQQDVIVPINYEQRRGFQYLITLKPGGQKTMTCFMRQIDLNFNLDNLLKLFRHFLLPPECYPKMDVYGDLPLIKCDVFLLDSYLKIVQNQQHIYALKGDMKINWTRPQLPHPQNYKLDPSLFPLNKQQSTYNIQIKGMNFRKYKRQMYLKKINNYRTLSSPLELNIKYTNVMKMHNGVQYTDMKAQYYVEALAIKICYKDYLEISQGFKKNDQQNNNNQQQNNNNQQQNNNQANNHNNNNNNVQADIAPPPAHTPHTTHKVKIIKFSIQLGLSQLPVPLLDLSFQQSSLDFQKIGNTLIFTSKLQLWLSYWNMMIGRWQPILQPSAVDITYRKDNANYMTLNSNSLLLDFSIQSIKVLKMIWKDVQQKGEFSVLGQQEMAKGLQISPYVIINRTGMNIFIDSEQIIPFKLQNNQKMHIQSKSQQLSEQLQIVNYQIQGDINTYDLSLKLNAPISPQVRFNYRRYNLIIHSVSSPILKQIIISSPFLIRNTTAFPFILILGTHNLRVEPQSKTALPFTQDIHQRKTMKLQFPHLRQVQKNFVFEMRDLQHGYQFYVQCQNEIFNCLIQLDTSVDNTISVCPLCKFVNLLPLDIKLQLALSQGNNQREILAESLGVSQEKMFYAFGSKETVHMRIQFKGFNYSQFHPLNLITEKQIKEVTQEIPFLDYRALPLLIHCKTIKKGKQRTIYLYSDNIFINQTPYRLFLFDNSELVPGQAIRTIPESQSKFVFLDSALQPTLGCIQDDPTHSKRIPSKDLGDQLMTVSNYNQLYQLVIRNSVICVHQQAQIFTSIVKALPRYVIVNKTTRTLCFQQVNTDQRVMLAVQQRKQWSWYHRQGFRLMSISALDNQLYFQGGWGHSAPLDPVILQQTVLVLRPSINSKQRLLLRIQIFKQNQQKFISIFQMKGREESLMHITNNLNLVELQVYQQYLDSVNQPWIEHKHFYCAPMSQVDFGWDYPHQAQKVWITFKFMGPYRSKFNSDILRLDVAEMNQIQSVQFEGDNGELLCIQIKRDGVGMRRKLTFQLREQQVVNENDQVLMQEMATNKMGISLNQIGISVIGTQPRCQILFMSVRRLQLIVLQKQSKRNYQLKIKYINIDNNLHHNTVFPVLFTPLYERKTLQKPRPFLVMLVQQNTKNKAIKDFNYFRMCIQPISLKLYDQILTELYDWQRKVNSVDQPTQQEQLPVIFQSYQQAGSEWMNRQLKSEVGSMFFKEVQMGKVVVQLSFSMRPTNSGNIIIHTIFTLFKTALSNVSESQMKLSRFVSRNLFAGELGNQLGEFYKNQVFKQIYKIAGSINIMGNPYVFVRYLATGVWEIVNQPSEGFIKGPIQGVIGIVKGGVYFVRNVVAGTFNSFEVIAQSCARGISNITFDEKFMARRQKIQMQRSRHIGQGLRSAGWAFYTGLQVAVTGVVRHPLQQKKKSGKSGFVKGLFIGLAGLFTKPLAGFFSAGSKFSQGIKQTALFFQDGPSTIRSRPPRLFISQQQYFNQYDLQQSKAVNLLQFHSTKHLQTTIMFVSADPHPQTPDDAVYTVLTSDFLVQLSRNSKKIIKQISLRDVSEAQADPQGLKWVLLRYGNKQELQIYTKKARQLFERFKDIFQINTQYQEAMIT